MSASIFPARRPSVVRLHAGADVGIPIGALTALLADTVAELFGDAVLVLHLVAPDGRRAQERIGGVLHAWLPTPAGSRSAAIVRAAIDRHRAAGIRDVFLDVSGEDPASLDRLVTDLVHLVRPGAASVAPPWPGCDVLRTVVLAGPAPGLAPRRSWIDSVVRGAAGDLVRARGPKGRGASYEELRSAPRECRVRLGSARVAPTYRDLPAAAQATFGRWARALTRRRVGLALGGSGAWGYASAALILELEARGVPIDLLGGSSSGALLGAYYCAAGIEGVARLVKKGRELGWGMPLMLLTSAVAEYAVDADLGSARLEELEIPLFPVATNLSRLRPEVLTHGTVGFGVRASVSAPGIFAPTVAGDAVYVDGAVTDNVPAALVESLGADLVIATNPLPASATPRRSGATLDPRRRLADLATSFDLLLHVAGDREASPRRIVYSAEPADAPLRTTFDYGAAERILEKVTREDTRFRAVIDAATAAYRDLSAPRREEDRRSLAGAEDAA